jgi:hypothetical protein
VVFILNFMRNFKYLILVVFIFLPVLSRAQVYINEVMYDSPGTDDDWAEIYNSSSVPVSIVTGSGSGSWRFVDNSGSHLLKLSTGSATLAPNSYAIVTNTGNTSKFLSDWPSFSGTIFESSFSLTNTDNTVSLKDGTGAVTDTPVEYSSAKGANGDGNSFSRQPDGTWIAAAPTPGAANSNAPLTITNNTQNTDTTASTTGDTTATTTDQTQADQTTGSGDQNDTTVWSANSSPASLPDTAAPVDFEISAGRDRLTSVGNNLLFTVTPIATQGVPSTIGYVWSFGDGSTGEGNTVYHTYKFAGEYSVVVNATASDLLAVDRLSVKVIDPQIALQKVPGGTQVTNNSTDEINLEGWTLVSENKSFVFPQDTLISAGQSVIFADKTTGISSDDLQLQNPLGKTYATLTGLNFVETADVAASPVSTKSLNDISESVSDISQKVAMLRSEINSAGGSAAVPEPKLSAAPQQPATTLAVAPTVTPVIAQQTPTQQISASTMTDTTNQSDQTATVFVASSSPGIITRIFSWPIRGFNFLRSLFIEK